MAVIDTTTPGGLVLPGIDGPADIQEVSGNFPVIEARLDALVAQLATLVPDRINGRACRAVTTQSFADDVPEALVFDTVQWETAPTPRLVAGSSRFTADRTGTFLVHAGITFQGASGPVGGFPAGATDEAFFLTRGVAIYLVKNGDLTHGAGYLVNASSRFNISTLTALGVSALVRMVAGDYVELYANQASDHDMECVVLSLGGSNDPAYNYLEYLQVA